MNSSPVDLTNLRTMTDGDQELEEALFTEFYSSFEHGIGVLKGNTDPAQAEVWRKTAHGLKGTALNLGAEMLGRLCEKAQEEPQAAPPAKQQLLQRIEAEYEQVKTYLKQVA